MAQTQEPEVLSFNKREKAAFIVTNGTLHAIYTLEGRTFAPKLSTAIARLEAQGYTLVPDAFYKHN